MKHIALALSIVAHPFLLPLYVLFITFHAGTVFSLVPEYTRLAAYALTVTGVILLPLLSLPLLKRLRLIESFALKEKHDRIFPVFITVVGAFLAFYFSRNIPYADIVRQLYLVLVVLLAGFMLLSIRWKVSMHMTAIGALCAFVFVLGVKFAGDVGDLLIGLILVAGVLGTCRLYLKRHTPGQVYGGFVYGVALVLALLF